VKFRSLILYNLIENGIKFKVRILTFFIFFEEGDALRRAQADPLNLVSIGFADRAIMQGTFLSFLKQETFSFSIFECF
jgi:hypothetical protein